MSRLRRQAQKSGVTVAQLRRDEQVLYDCFCREKFWPKVGVPLRENWVKPMLAPKVMLPLRKGILAFQAQVDFANRLLLGDDW